MKAAADICNKFMGVQKQSVALDAIAKHFAVDD